MKTKCLLFIVTTCCTASCSHTKPNSHTTLNEQTIQANESQITKGQETPPTTDKVPVWDVLHDVGVRDDYRWLEDWDDNKVKLWTKKQNFYARKMLSKIHNRDSIRKQLESVLKGDRQSYSELRQAGGKLFALKTVSSKQQPVLVFTNDFRQTKTEVVFDPNQFDPNHSTTIDWFLPSHDGKLVAVSLSKGGSEMGSLYFFETGSGRQVYEVIERVNAGTGGGTVAWTPDNKGVYYSRYPRKGEVADQDLNFFVQVYFHRLGTKPTNDRYQIGKHFPKIAEIHLQADEDTDRVLATVQNGDGGEFAIYLRSKQGKWAQIAQFKDKVTMAMFGKRDGIYLVSNQNAPRGKLTRLKISASLSLDQAQIVLPQVKDTLVTSFWGAPSIVIGQNTIYATYQLGGPSEIRAFSLEGKPLAAPTQFKISSVSQLTLIGRDDIIFSNQSYVGPSTVFFYSRERQQTEKTGLYTRTPAKFTNVEVVREFAQSKDGTQIPVNIIKPKETKLDGKNPLILYGYGGYGVNLTPKFSEQNTVLLDHGILYAVANIRGGGEYGKKWHLQGNLTNKQNCFNDFAAAAQHLIKKGYTSSSRLGLRGGSNGGLLMGAMVTQHPTLATAVVSHVGIYDMLRVELSSNGQFNVTEFGTVKDPDQFRALLAYSPYHHVKDGSSYPAILMLTGINDPRVDPMQSRKMIARLQAAARGDKPILLRTEYHTGHGFGTPLDTKIDELVDEFSFYFHYLKVDPSN